MEWHFEYSRADDFEWHRANWEDDGIDDPVFRIKPDLYPVNAFYFGHWYLLQQSKTEHGIPFTEIVCYVENALWGILPGSLVDFSQAMVVITEAFHTGTKRFKAKEEAKAKGKKQAR